MDLGFRCAWLRFAIRLYSRPAPSGGLPELIVLRPGTLVLEVPEGLTDAVVCPANCATAAMAAAEGAAEVRVVDPDGERRESPAMRVGGSVGVGGGGVFGAAGGG